MEDSGRETKLEVLARYKFTLAFENSIRRDYVTEKFFDALVAGSVPVYLGAPNIDEFGPGEHCFIDASKFRDPRALADYLLHLASNESEYQAYLAWKDAPFAPAFLEKAARYDDSPFSRLSTILRGRAAGSDIRDLQRDPLHAVVRVLARNPRSRGGSEVPTEVQLSVVIATTHPWPNSQECLEILLPQIAGIDAEILLADSSGIGLPEPVPEHLKSVRWIKALGASVFHLRAIGTSAATGKIIAWTEDHCRPATDWCEKILKAHSAHPELAAIGGSMENGSTTTTSDWANFLTTFAPFIAPIDLAKTDRVPPAANISFKRRAIPTGEIGPGEIEFVIKPQLLKERLIGIDDRIVVRHIQSRRLLESAIMHFHNGRSTSGLIASQLSNDSRRQRLRRCFRLPQAIVQNVTEPLAGKTSVEEPLRRALPIIRLLAICHAAGEFWGLVFRTAGSSPTRLE